MMNATVGSPDFRGHHRDGGTQHTVSLHSRVSWSSNGFRLALGCEIFSSSGIVSDGKYFFQMNARDVEDA